MKNVLRFFIIVFFLAVPAFLSAASVSVLMCQNNSDIETLRGTTVMIENGVLEILFDRGHIVSGSKAAIGDCDMREVGAQALKNSAEGFFEFMVQIVVTYKKSAMRENPAKIIFDDIDHVDLNLVRVRTGHDIYEKKNIVPVKSEHENDTQALKRFAQELGYAVANVIQGTR